MVIVTGMDNSGKTTLCNTLRKLMNLPVVHSPGPGMTSDEKKLWTQDQIIRDRAMPNRVIYDRFMPLEEMVYGPILRGHSDFSPNDQYMEELLELDPRIIYTRPSRKTILEDNGREQMDGVREKGEQLLAAWDDLIFRLIALDCQVWVYDWSVSTLSDEDIEEIFGGGE